MGKLSSRIRRSLRRFLRWSTASSARGEAPAAPPREQKGVSETDIVSQRRRPKPSLENLPVEVQRQILFAVQSLEDLSALVHASPVYYQLYRVDLDRGPLLWNCLRRALGGVLVDAHAAHMCESDRFQRTRTKDKIREFLTNYQSMRLAASPGCKGNNLSKDPPTEDAIKVAVLYAKVVRPMVKMYTIWALAHLGSSLVPGPLSRTEQTRILRGLYRFQIFYNLFGQRKDLYRPHLERLERLEHFLCLYEPWEVEEIACINAFAYQTYDRLFQVVSWDLHPDNPKFDDGRTIVTPTGAFHLETDFQRKSHADRTVSQGLELLSAALKAVNCKRDELVEILSRHLYSGNYDDCFEISVDQWTQEERRQRSYSDRDRAEDNREKMPFNKSDGAASPPIAWVIIWQGKYSNSYGTYIPDGLRRWGYVMWDPSRLKKYGAKEVLIREWELKHGRYDPRYLP